MRGRLMSNTPWRGKDEGCRHPLHRSIDQISPCIFFQLETTATSIAEEFALAFY
jgi:hypothetical protein